MYSDNCISAPSFIQMNTTIPKRQPLEWCFFGIAFCSHIRFCDPKH